ncbi:MAG: hypothetical protein A4E38_01537 [Methanoregulaceae archaeon PtaB.Bin108]|nr:MAG: hypothetical protein A4E38_01537 [Methanoregulaceae archaeon PtaB.Bin108]
MRVKTAPRGCHEIPGPGPRDPEVFEVADAIIHALQQCRIRGPEVGSPRSGGVIGRSRCRRRASLKIEWAGEGKPDQLRSRHRSAPVPDKTPVGLGRKCKFGNTRHKERVGDAGDEEHYTEQEYCCPERSLPGHRGITAEMRRSMALIPRKGATIPPSPKMTRL